MNYSSSAGWSVIQTLPTGNRFVISPTMSQLHNSSIILLWSSNQTGRWNLYYKFYSNGAWHGTVQLTTGTSFDDFFPEVAVSTNSTVYVFWERFFSSTSASIYYKTLKGNTWSADTQLTFYGDVNTPLDDLSPSVVQGVDKTLWIFYSTDYPSAYEFDIYYVKSSSIFPVHNVVITQIQSGPYAFQKNYATVLVTLSNQGDYYETIQLTITAANLTSYTIASAVSENVPAGSTVTLGFSWNIGSAPLGRYVITVSYPRLTGQSLLASGGDQLQFRVLTLVPPIKVGACHTHSDCPV